MLPLRASITGTSSSDCLVLNQGQSYGKSYSSADMQTVYSTAPAKWAKNSSFSKDLV